MAWTPIEELLPPVKIIHRNILDTYLSANAAERRTGLAWYKTAHEFALKISCGEIEKGAGIIACYSPQKSWIENSFLAARTFEQGYASGHTKAVVAKADRILAGEPALDVLGGQKVRSFYKAICNPNDPHVVVVDRHAFDVAWGKVTDDLSRKVLERVGGYNLVAETYRTVGQQLQMIPSHLQATTWIRWKREKRSLRHTG